MTYIFSVADAVNLGVYEAIVLSHFKYWVLKNKAANKNFFKDKYWTTIDEDTLEKIFPFFDKQTIQQTIKSLEAQKAIIRKHVKGRTVYTVAEPEQTPEPPKTSKKHKNKPFVKPTITEIQAYIEENKLNAVAEEFYDYYEANGWKINRNPMKDWQASLRNWSRRQYSRPNGKYRGKGGNEFLDMLKTEKMEEDAAFFSEAVEAEVIQGEEPQ